MNNNNNVLIFLHQSITINTLGNTLQNPIKKQSANSYIVWLISNHNNYNNIIDDIINVLI